MSDITIWCDNTSACRALDKFGSPAAIFDLMIQLIQPLLLQKQCLSHDNIILEYCQDQINSLGQID